MDMIIYEPFLGENLIKCLFRYYSLLPEYVKEIFVEMYLKTNSEVQEHQAITKRMEKELQIKLNLKFTHFPNSVKRIDPKALLNNNLL